MAIRDAALGQIVRRHLEGHTVAGKNANAITAQFAGQMGEYDAFLVELDTEQAAGELLNNGSGYFDAIFLTHQPPDFLLKRQQVEQARSRAFILAQRRGISVGKETVPGR